MTPIRQLTANRHLWAWLTAGGSMVVCATVIWLFGSVDHNLPGPVMVAALSITPVLLAGVSGLIFSAARAKSAVHETALRESQDRLSLALTAACMGVWEWDLRTDEVFWSDECQEITGIETAPKGLAAFIAAVHPDDLSTVRAALEHALAHRTRYEVEFRIVLPDGAVRWLSNSGRATYDDTGQPVRMQGTIHEITVRKQEETEHRHTTTLLRAITDGTADAIFVKDREGRYLMYNPAAARMVGRPIEQVIGCDDADLFGPDAAARIIAMDRRVMASGETETTEHDLTIGGVTHRMMVTKSPYRDGRGAILGVIGISCDVTDRKQAEEALRESEDRHRRLVEMLPDAVFVDCDEEIVFCNSACVQLMGATDAAELLGRSIYDVFHADDHAAIRAGRTLMRDTGRHAPRTEERVCRLDGRTVPVHLVATPILDRGKWSVLVALHDLTALRRSDEWVGSILSHTLDGIISINPNGTISSFNRAAEGIFGYATDEVMGQDVEMLMPERRRPAHHHSMADYLRTGQARLIGSRRELEGRRKDGSTFPMDLAVTEFEFAEERHFIGIVQDISERRRLEDQLRQAQKMEALGQVSGGVAHDFNNLLTVISGYSEILIEALPKGSQARILVEDISRAGKRAADLTRQLLAFSRRTVLEPKVVDLNVVVTEMNRMLARVIGEDVALTHQLDPAIRRVRVDPGHLEQIVMNLAVNARDAMPTGGRLTIETRMDVLDDTRASVAADRPAGRYVMVSMRDTGCGMTPDVKARIFEPFFTTKGAGRGTGLGLAVVHGLVKQGGGYIDVDSEPGVGTTFRIYFPSVDLEVVKPAVELRAGASLRGTETVLLVEDEDTVRKLACRALQTYGYRVLQAEDGVAALRVIDAHDGPIDLLATDVVMPSMSGGELAHVLQTRRPGLKVLFMSGYTDDAVLRHGIQHADVHFLPKPYTPQVLLRKIREVIDQA